MDLTAFSVLKIEMKFYFIFLQIDQTMSPASPLDLAYQALHQAQQVLADARQRYDQRLEENPQIRNRLFHAGTALNHAEEMQLDPNIAPEVSLEAYQTAYHEYNEANEAYDTFMIDVNLDIRNASTNVRLAHQTIQNLQTN
jgi:hypothetical protein